MLRKIRNIYNRHTLCRKLGHFYIELPTTPQCERIYTAELLDKHYRCMFCGKEVDQWEYMGKLVNK